MPGSEIGMTRLGSQGWGVHGGDACPACSSAAGRRDMFWARQWLQQFRSDPAALATIRRLVLESETWWPLHKATNDQVIEWMAKLVGDGVWHAHAPVLPKDDSAGPGEAAAEVDLAEIVSSAPAVRESPEPPPPPQEAALLPGNADEAAIATSMKTASALGIPFCEECAKAAAMKRAQGIAHG